MTWCLRREAWMPRLETIGGLVVVAVAGRTEEDLSEPRSNLRGRIWGGGRCWCSLGRRHGEYDDECDE